MNKFLLAFATMFMIFNATATEYKEGTHYEVINKPASAEPRVVEFFSFYCGGCYQFDQKARISEKLKNLVPENGTYTKYHVSFMGGETGVLLTKAWGLAMTLKVEEKIKPLMFEGVQIKRNINSLEDIRDVFIKAGVKDKEFDDLWDSFVVNSLVVKQQKEADNYQLKGVPAVYINGKYQTMNQNMSTIDELLDVAKYLLAK